MWRSSKSTRLHQCGPGSNPCVETISGLSLLLVISLAPRVFSLGTPVFPSPQKPTLPNSNSTLNAQTRLTWSLLGVKKSLDHAQIGLTLNETPLSARHARPGLASRSWGRQKLTPVMQAREIYLRRSVLAFDG